MTADCIDTKKYEEHMKTCKRCSPDSDIKTFLVFAFVSFIILFCYYATKPSNFDGKF